MNVLYILGNGFDKAQNLKTSYPEFYDYLEKQEGSVLLQELKSSIKRDKKLWSDMEEAFGEFTSEINTEEAFTDLYFELSGHLQTYLALENNKFTPSDELKNKFQADFVAFSRYLGELDKMRYSNFTALFRNTNVEINVMTLNYTFVLENLLSIKNRESNVEKTLGGSRILHNIVHVHGVLEDTIIIGVDNEQQIANQDFQMNENVKVVFGLIGGLALFLYGMNSMSDALQKAAGERMKKILGFLTRNPIMGALAGALVTAVLQSSSATTVMVIGFVSAGLMSLPQAISVIFGANIGTTMTAQLMAFKISNYIYPIIFVGFILNFVSKKEKVKNIGMVIFSFGLLFEGIEIMGEVMKPLAGSPVFVDLMGKVSSIPVLGVVLGAVMTLVVQSSSATIAVLQNFASQAGPDGVSSVIGLTGAIPILLGDNIGTTITALLASIGQSKNAKRTAIAHSIFNISGSCVFIFLVPWFAKFVQFISPKGNEIDVISRQIANAHTTFNIVCTLVWLPLIPLMVKIVTTIIRGNDKTEKAAFEPKYLDMKVIEQPAAAMVLVSKELNRLGELAESLLSDLKIWRLYISYRTV